MSDTWTGAGRWLLTMAMLLLGICLGQPARAAVFDDIIVDELAVPRPDKFEHGSVEYRFRLFNNSTDKTHNVTLAIPDTINSGQGQITRTVTLGPLVEARVSLWQPEMSLGGGSLNVAINGRMHPDTLPVSMSRYENYPSYYSSTGRRILVSPRLDPTVRDQLDNLASKWNDTSRSSSYGPSMELQRASVPPAQWSESWLGYTAYDGVIIGGEDFRTMPASVRQAMLTYVEAGGSLLVIGAWTLPAQWQAMAGQARPLFNGEAQQRFLGLGSVIQLDAATTVAMGESDFKELDTRLWSPVMSAETSRQNIQDANELLPVTDSLAVPARSMLLLMIVFAVVIGPVNMFYFSRINRRIWTLATIPMFALVFSVVVFVLALFAEGVRARGRATSLTMLDQDTGRALTIGWAGYYAPIMPGDGLRFDADTLVSHQDQADGYLYRNTTSRKFIDWSSGQHLSAGWIRSRVPSHFRFKTSQVRREKLQVTQDDAGQVSIVNGLGSDIQQITLTDAKGNIHYSGKLIPAGQRVTLERGKASGKRAADMRDAMGGMDWVSRPDALNFTLGVDLSTYGLPAGSYVAVLAEPVFVERGLPNLSKWETQNTVLGRFAAGSDREQE